MTIDCKTAKTLIEKRVDGLLPSGSEAELNAHLSSCRECAVERSREAAVGRLLKSHIDSRVASAQGGLDMMWTRVRAGIEEGKPAEGILSRWMWAPFPAGALAITVFALLLYFYPTGLDRSPFNPRTFDVYVEEMESEIASVMQLDMGEGLPRVIWITEDAES
ncbi:MAG: zf-HC2 domain-containing protein [Syntrophorhabdaceae bacterium]|nr:zf-HC2 domain-containing protein [Syntrophorhabdaceae bacterium]